jgi:ligand-binding sensor domain-containing protein
MICLLCCNAYSQQFPNIQFNYLTEKEGLSSNEVTCISQDEEGFIWIGTVDGLNRYDGYRVKHFFYNAVNENSLVNNSIYHIVPDMRGQLWITTREGLSVLDKKTGVFHNFRHNPSDSNSMDDDQYADIYADSGRSAWVTTSSSVYQFDNSFQYKKIQTGIKGLIDLEKKSFSSYTNLFRDRQGRLWASHHGYVFLVDPKTMRVAKKFGPYYGSITSFFQDSGLQFWIGSFGGGLVRFDPQSGEIFPVKLTNPYNTVVYSITEWWDKNHTRWLIVGSDVGLVFVNPVTLENKELSLHQGNSPEQFFTKNVVRYVFVDRQNILWIGTEAGVCYARPSRQLFDLWNISNSGGLVPTQASDWIYSIAEMNNEYWMSRWIGYGLYHFNKDGVLIEAIPNLKTSQGLLSLSDSLKPYYLQSEGDSILWITTDASLIHYDLRSKKASFYKVPNGSWETGLRTILPVDDHSWWIRTRNNGPNGIYIFDPINKKFTKHLTHTSGGNDCVPADLLTLLLSSKRQIYATAMGEGLFKYDSASGRFLSLFKFQGKDLKQHSNSFEAIAEDRDGILWISTYTGLFAYDPLSRKVVRDYTNNELLGGVDVSGIVIDKQQNVWLSTERGVYYILHSNGQVRELTNTSGMKNNSNGTFQIGKNDFIYNGIRGYLVRIQPMEVLSHFNQNVSVHFSDATVMDVPRFFHFTSSGQKEMIMKPGQNRFSLDFSVMNYDGDNRYYYKLDGAMNDWQQNENGHLAFYNLSPGKYTLHVKGGNQYGDLRTNEDEVTIVVQPYWWQTNLFKLSCLGVAIALTVFLIRRRIIHIRQEASFKQKIAETEMMALRSQMNPHFIFNSLNSIENFMMQNEKRLASSYLNKFARLIRTILDTSHYDLIPISKDMEALRLYVDLEQLRFNNKFCFKLHVDPSLLNGDYKAPALLIQPYVENAIVHGLAHSEKDSLELSVGAFLDGEYIHYTIQDNGIGRKLSSMYNRQNKPHHKSVGLSITEERIYIFNQKHNANGGVMITDLFDEDNQPAGTKVQIRIKAV